MAKEKEQFFITGENAFKTYGHQYLDDQTIPYSRGKAITSRTFINHDTNISVKSDYNYKDYDYFRPSTTVPEKKEEIIQMCMQAYKKVGLVKNIIDLMGDFGSQGIRLQHPDPRMQQFYQSLWQKVGGPSRSERFLNQLYRCGQVIVKKSYGKVSNYQERKWKKGVAEDIKLERLKVKSREIPLKYRFISPLSVEVIAPDLAQFVGSPPLGLKIGTSLRTSISRALAQDEKMVPAVKKMLNKIPKDVLEAIKRGDKLLPLDPDKISIYYYKRDDWELWADPLCYCILDDLLMLNQLKLADRSALDGAISNIRLWTLGIIGDSPVNSILPTKTAINKLRSILSNNVGGGVMDLVWGPELKFEESNSQVYHWLGSEKYENTINNIYEGLGIPASLRAGSGSTNTGNFIGLNTLIKRLQYGRDKLVDFWNEELKYIHKAMGFQGSPPRIMFDFMALADEPAERKLLMDLWDRDIISDNTILELFGRLPDVEKARVKRESKDRTFERMPYKASPFHNPDKEHDYRKILLQGGDVTPSEIGIDLDDRKEGEVPRLEKMAELKEKYSPQKEGGRPPNVTETKKRKPKTTERQSTNAFDVFMWANHAQEQISNIVTPSLLYACKKKDSRSLSKEEVRHCENIKFGILCSLKPFEDITNERIYAGLVYSDISQTTSELVSICKSNFINKYKREPKIDEMRQIYSICYSILCE